MIRSVGFVYSTNSYPSVLLFSVQPYIKTKPLSDKFKNSLATIAAQERVAILHYRVFYG